MEQDDATVAPRDFIMLRGEEIPVASTYLEQALLRFYPENPRIYSRVWTDDDAEPSQELIQQELARTDHVREVLIPSIRHNGGLIEPILVRGNVVLEGNSRLAAYRVLGANGDERWNLIRARVLPDTITDSQVFSLLGEYHIVGKKDWAPYEQAGYLWRRNKRYGIKEAELTAELGLTEAKIKKLIQVYDFMVNKNDRDPARWSYYDELFTGKRFDKARKLFPDFDDVISAKIKSGEIRRAVDLRDELPLIQEVEKTLRRFVTGKVSFEDAVDDARMKGAGSTIKRKLDDFRQWIGQAERDSEVEAAQDQERSAIKYDLQKITDRANALLKKHFKN